MKYQILSPHNSGSNCLSEIIHSLGFNINVISASKGSTYLWKHTINEQEILKLQKNPNYKIIMLIRNPFFWFISNKKANYLDIKKFEEDIFMSKAHLKKKFLYEDKTNINIQITLINLYNKYLRIYNKIKNKDNCLLISYEEIINFDFHKLFKFLKIKNSDNNFRKIIRVLEYKQKTHGSSKNIYDAIDYYTNFSVNHYYTTPQIKFIKKNIILYNNMTSTYSKDILDFNYILEKIKTAKIINHPFPHLDIKNFLSKIHLQLIMIEKQIHFEEKSSNDELYNKLIQNDWKIQGFPGCTTNWNDYKKYIKCDKKYSSGDPVENIGITFRLHKYKNNIIKKLIEFMNSNEFHRTLKKKFNINNKTTIITAIQKNLTGYEISPHPDIRQKCLTYLLNINNNKEIENLDCNTHLLEFKDKYKYIQKYWEKNKGVNRCWVPWEWCNTIKKMSENNSMLIFKPDSNPPTLHAIRLKYNHLKYQRTQIYGNLMYKDPPCPKPSNYKDFLK